MSFILRRLSANLLANSDLELNNGAADFDNWVEAVSGTSTIAVAAGFTGDGARLTIDAVNSAASLEQSGVVAVNNTYRAKLRGKISNASGTSHLHVWNGPAAPVDVKTVTLQTAWAEYTIDDVAESGGTSFFVRRGDDCASDILDLDDLRLYQLFGEITLPDPGFSNAEAVDRMQAARQSSAGSFFVYDRGVSKREYVFAWPGTLLSSNRDALRNFFDTVAKGMLNTFEIEYDDWRPTQFGGTGSTVLLSGVRFVHPRLDFRELRNGHYFCEIVVRED